MLYQLSYTPSGLILTYVSNWVGAASCCYMRHLPKATYLEFLNKDWAMKIQIECIRITADLPFQPWSDLRSIKEEEESETPQKKLYVH